MNNPFNKVGRPPQPLPKKLKKKVMDDIAMIQLLMDTASLFTESYANAIESIFKNDKRNNTKN